MSDINKTIETILENRDYTSMFNSKKLPFPGQFISTGMQFGGNALKMVGYCVQIRKNIGMFGSHMYLIRHADGVLTIHENQSYYAMTKEQENNLRPFFSILPEQEDFTKAFSLQNGAYPEVGFIIDKNDMETIPPVTENDVPFKIVEIDQQGNQKITIII